MGLGYYRAGFDVVGIDNKPQPNYPFKFIQVDALKALRSLRFMRQFHAVHASAPCQAYTFLRHRGAHLREPVTYPELVTPTRKLLKRLGLPYVMENVPGSPLIEPTTLCGSMFGLPIQRHRLFETSFSLAQPECNHSVWVRRFPASDTRKGYWGTSRIVQIYGTGGGPGKDLAMWRWAMGIDWMDKAEISQAVPPAYTEFVGWQLLDHLAELDWL